MTDSVNHSHPDFQGGRRHSVDRRHQGDLSPELHQDQAPTTAEIRSGVPRRRRTEVTEIDPDRMQAKRDYALALSDIPIEQLYGHQLEEMGICGDCRGPLKHPMDKHYHSRNDGGAMLPVCCKCAEEHTGKECPDTWTKVKHLREKISAMSQTIAERRYYWVCVPCGHKWRTKSADKRACADCGSKRVKGVSTKERAS